MRERIDSEAFVVPWSSVDTAMGVLNVHLDDHSFDAEPYGDELGLPPERVLPAGIGPDDVRLAFFSFFRFRIAFLIDG